MSRFHADFETGYSLSPDLANAAMVSVSLLEGNMKEGSQIRVKMVLKRQDFEILRSQFFLYSMLIKYEFFAFPCDIEATADMLIKEI